jgi:hypothetical protein
MKMLFLAPESVRQPAGVMWRCAGCDMRISETEQHLPTFCVFCKAWAQWRQVGDEMWARALRRSDDDGGSAAVHFSAASAA